MSTVALPHRVRGHIGLGVAAALAVFALLLVLRSDPAPEPRVGASGGEAEAAAAESYGELPLAFEPNAGRTRGGVDFIARSAGGTAFITGSGATILASAGERRSEAVRLDLLGAADSKPLTLERLPGVVNDLVGEDASHWRTNLPTFERVRYSEVYPGVALDWHGDQRRLEYDFRVAPGADPSQIRLKVGGADSLRLAGNGDLVIGAGEATLRQHAPIAYQPGSGGGDRVPASFDLEGRTLGLRLGAYDPTRPLVIDPVLGYSGYLGGNMDDSGRAIAVDSTGAAYVGGDTASTDFNLLNSIEPDSVGRDVVVSKLTPAGALSYSTYIGGGADDFGWTLTADSSGSAYVAGETASTDFNTVNPIEMDSAGNDAFVAKLTAAGSGLAYSTYLGGGDLDQAFGIAVDSAGQAYVTGSTDSTDFNTVGPFEGDSGGKDVFISKLNAAGSALVYSTYLGGIGLDQGFAIAVDGSGQAYVTGRTVGTDFDTLNPIEGDQPSQDVFISKLTAAGNALAYSTYLGGDGIDTGGGIAVDGAGQAYVAGDTESTDFNVVNQIEADSDAMVSDAFVSKVNAGGNALMYSTYLGGSNIDRAEGIAIDSAGQAYVTGWTDSTDFNQVNQIEGDSAGRDVFISKLRPAGNALSYSTYLGGNSSDSGADIAVDPSGNAYVTGDTGSTDFNLVNSIEGDSALDDFFISKLTAPVNDDFEAATALAGFSPSATGNSTGASFQPGEPTHAGLPAFLSVWYRWTAPASGAVTAETCASGFDTLIAVKTGSTLGGLTEIAGNDNTPGCGTGGSRSRTTFTAVAGTTYHLVVDGGNAGGPFFGPVSLVLQGPPVPPAATPVTPVAPTATPPVAPKCRKGFKLRKGRCVKKRKKKKK